MSALADHDARSSACYDKSAVFRLRKRRIFPRNSYKAILGFSDMHLMRQTKTLVFTPGALFGANDGNWSR